MFFIGIIKDINISEIVMLSISLIVAAISEVLPAVINITLCIEMSTLAKKMPL